jgi:hypothetical protein
MTPLEELVKKVSINDLTICVFANNNYIPVLEIWNKYFKNSTNSRCIVFALDEKTHEYCVQNCLDVFFAPFEGDWLGFMRHQMVLTRKILSLNHTVLVSDIDAIWVKNPLEYTLANDSDMVFSPGTIQPPRAHAQWGNVLCTGYFLIRPRDQVNAFLDCVEKRMLNEGDQPAINHELLERGLTWEGQECIYHIEFREKQILQTHSPRRGHAGDLSVTLLPNRYFQRLEEEEDALIIHPISPKQCADKLRVFGEIGVI